MTVVSKSQWIRYWISVKKIDVVIVSSLSTNFADRFLVWKCVAEPEFGVEGTSSPPWVKQMVGAIDLILQERTVLLR